MFVCEQETSDPTWHSKAIKLCDRVLEVKEEERFKVDEIDPNNVPASGCCYYTLLFRASSYIDFGTRPCFFLARGRGDLHTVITSP